MRVIFLEHDPLTASVEQQLHTRHAWSGRRVAGVNLPHLSALQERVLFRVDRLTPVEVGAARGLRSGAGVDMRSRIEVFTPRNEIDYLFVTVLRPRRYPVIARSEDVAAFVDEDAPNTTAKTR